MVVLDGHNMMGTGPNQYLQPDYLSPLPTTLDAKKSPLALLAQTCSQIGADSPNTKSLLPSLDSKRKSSTSSDSSTSLNLSSSNTSDSHHNSSGPCKGQERDRDRDSASRPRSGNSSGTPAFSASTKSTGTGKSSPAFKPYESFSQTSLNLTSKREESARKSPLESAQHPEKPKTPSKRAASNSPNHDSSCSGGSGSSSAKQPRKSPPSGGDKKSGSGCSDDGKSSPKSSGAVSTNNDDHSSASPIIRSGLEVLQGHGLGGNKDFKANSSALSSLSALAAHYPPGFDPTNPAMRPPFFGPPSHPFLGGAYPPSALGSNGMPPYVSYTRVKTPSGAETIVPVCKDPFCTGCSLSMPGLMANAAAMAAAAGFPGFLSAPPGSGGVCPAGCVQCDHQKFSIGLPPFMAPPPGLGLSAPATSTAGYPSSLLSQHAQAAAAAAQQQQQHSQRPFICNWIMGDGYCGKRYPSSDELFQHLRTHPNTGSTSEASNLTSAMSSPASLYSNALLSSSMSAAAAAAAAMHRTYPTPPLSPLSAARYNPYAAASLAAAAGKPGGPGGFGVPTSLSSLVPHPQSLANYYSNLSPYAMYGQRIGPPVHP